MICQFSFSNYKSYRDETIFDFQASKISEFSESLIRAEGESGLLPVSVIYGPNGGGKSNLLAALGSVISLVVSPVVELDKNRNRFVIQQRPSLSPYLFDEGSREEPTSFEIYFRTKGNEFRYRLAVRNGEVFSESLYRKSLGAKRPAKIFEREGDAISVGYGIRMSGINVNVNSRMPYLSFLAINYSLDVISEVMDWFESCIFRNYGNPMAERQILLAENEVTKESFINMMNALGIEITGYRYDEARDEFWLQRTINGQVYELPFANESDGTKKLFAAVPVILLAITEGRLLIIDELDAKLHPLLLRNIIKLFTNPQINLNGAQLLFTSHDMTTMKNTVFRRDEIWFAAMGQGNASEIYSLYEIRKEDNERVKNTAAYDKQYLEGRYQADPYLKRMLNWEDMR